MFCLLAMSFVVMKELHFGMVVVDSGGGRWGCKAVGLFVIYTFVLKCNVCSSGYAKRGSEKMKYKR